MKRKVIGIAVLFAAAAAAILWASGLVKNPFLPFLALGLFFLGTNFFGKVSEFAVRIRPLRGRRVQVQVWGSALSKGNGGSFVIHAVRAIGAGLHLYLRPIAGGSPKHLKVAQPIGATTSDDCVEVKEAKYVQWDGRMIKKVTGVKALVLNLEK
jgi:hypothetical protein